MNQVKYFQNILELSIPKRAEDQGSQCKEKYTPSALFHTVKSICPIHFPLPAVHRTKQAFWEILHQEFRSTRPALVSLCPRAFYPVPDWHYDVLPCDVLTAA